MKALCLNIALILFTLVSFSQSGKAFEPYKSHHIIGDATFIGNNILSKSPDKAFDDYALLNDQLRMLYVDIDNDGSTFNSSSATLKIPHANPTIVEATLVWSAVYPFEIGEKKERKRQIYYEGNDKRNSDHNTVKFKTPGGEYVDINGNLLFDGFEKEGFEETAPYAFFADVTNLINPEEINGQYTVANIRGTKGFLSGGAAGGWMLYVVYESEECSPKYISSYHGFSYLTDTFIDLEFDDFQSVKSGTVDASIIVGALEGDAKLSRDHCSIFNPTDSTFVPLKNRQRAAQNFFNGKITYGDALSKNRKPNSKHTLGFDLLETSIPKELLINDQSSTVVRLGTRADRFYLFFTAFKIEVNQLFQLNKVAEDLTEVAETDEEESTEELTEESAEETQESVETESKEENTASVENKKEVEQMEESSKETAVEVEEKPSGLSVAALEKRMKRRTLRAEGIEPGYYIITNVFSKATYAKKWSDYLISEGHEPKTLINPKNNWRYVYVYVNPDIEKVYNSYRKLAKLDYFKEIWVFKINL